MTNRETFNSEDVEGLRNIKKKQQNITEIIEELSDKRSKVKEELNDIRSVNKKAKEARTDSYKIGFFAGCIFIPLAILIFSMIFSSSTQNIYLIAISIIFGIYFLIKGSGLPQKADPLKRKDLEEELRKINITIASNQSKLKKLEKDYSARYRLEKEAWIQQMYSQ